MFAEIIPRTHAEYAAQSSDKRKVIDFRRVPYIAYTFTTTVPHTKAENAEAIGSSLTFGKLCEACLPDLFCVVHYVRRQMEDIGVGFMHISIRLCYSVRCVCICAL